MPKHFERPANIPALESLNSVAFTKPNKHKMRSEGFSTTWPNLFSNSFATVGEFKRHFKRYSVDILHDFEGFSFPRRFIYLRGIAFSGLFR